MTFPMFNEIDSVIHAEHGQSMHGVKDLPIIIMITSTF